MLFKLQAGQNRKASKVTETAEEWYRDAESLLGYLTKLVCLGKNEDVLDLQKSEVARRRFVDEFENAGERLDLAMNILQKGFTPEIMQTLNNAYKKFDTTGASEFNLLPGKFVWNKLKIVTEQLKNWCSAILVYRMQHTQQDWNRTPKWHELIQNCPWSNSIHDQFRGMIRFERWKVVKQTESSDEDITVAPSPFDKTYPVFDKGSLVGTELLQASNLAGWKINGGFLEHEILYKSKEFGFLRHVVQRHNLESEKAAIVTTPEDALQFLLSADLVKDQELLAELIDQKTSKKAQILSEQKEKKERELKIKEENRIKKYSTRLVELKALKIRYENDPNDVSPNSMRKARNWLERDWNREPAYGKKKWFEHLADDERVELCNLKEFFESKW